MAEKYVPGDAELFARATRLSSAGGEKAVPEAVPPTAVTRPMSTPPAPPPPPLLHQSAPEPVAPSLPLVMLPAAERYTSRDSLGRGGMGEVLLARDHTIGREVAMKQIRRGDPGPDLQARFVREARVQGQLEHPAIVPVYDVGVNAEGALYFTMKRVRGMSLADVLSGLRAGNAELARRYSQRRLLTVFSSVCMAVHFAHEKGVVHRDLKPANVMLGDFGEVYLLDWGLAALRGRGESTTLAEADGAHTLGGGVMGTPGYMAPEQIRDPSGVDAPADVYSLGAILFELLTLERLHAQPAVAEILRSTLELDGASPAGRAPDREISPELDRLVHEATRLDPAQRGVASARELSLRVEAFLDGDRDLALRRELAAGHAAAAEASLARAADPAVEHAERARAMREVTAALGLDPDHPEARRTLIRLITEPPATVPAEAEADIAANSLVAYTLAGKSALIFYACYLLYLPLLFWMGVRDWTLFALGWATIVTCAITTNVLVKRPPARINVPLAHLGVSTFTVATVSVLFGAYILVPMLALGMCVAYTASIGHRRGAVPIASCLAVIVPAVLGWLGVIPSGYRFEHGQWIVLPTVFHISPVATQVFLLSAIVGTVAPACLFVARLRKAYGDAERKLQLQAWQLRQIVPERLSAR